MASPRVVALCVIFALLVAPLVRAQQTRSADSLTSGVNANGMLLAENSSAVEQSRLLRDATLTRISVDANGNALPETDSGSSDDGSFGAQQILQTRERPPPFVLSGGASFVYTSNAALTRDGTEGDIFAVIDAGVNWSSRIGKNLEANLSLHAGIFRYDKMPKLDFNSLGFGTGLTWNPANLRGVSFFGRYDFTELLTRGSDEILSDHALTLGVQKVIAFGRSHTLTIGATGMLDISDPHAAERSQVGAFVSYHLQISRRLDSDLLLRPALHVYTGSDRVDWNNIVSVNLRYHLNECAELNGFLSYGLNRSNLSRFDYDVATTGAGVGFDFRF